MVKSSGLSRVIAVAASFIALEIAAIVLLSGSSTIQNIWLNRLSYRAIGLLWGGKNLISDYFTLKDINNALTSENEALTMELLKYKNLFDAVMEGKSAEGGREMFCCIPAGIVKLSHNTQDNYIILNKGSEDGVVPNSGIITSNGVVGIVTAVDRHYSYGMTIMNPRVSVSSRVGWDGVLAPLSWSGVSSDKYLLKEVPSQYAIELGDTVYTSGFSAIFPKDIPIGVVSSVKSVNGAANDVTVDLFLKMRKLRHVTIVVNSDREAIDTLEKL